MMSSQHFVLLLMCALAVTAEVLDDGKNETISPTATEKTVDYSEFIESLSSDNASADNATVQASTIQYSTDKQLEDNLYEAIYYYNYDQAVEQCKAIVKEKRQHVIKSTVDFLIKHKSSKVVPFAYKLWAAKGAVVVEKLFPEEFEMVFNDTYVIFTNYWYHVPIELGSREDLQNDIFVYGNDRNPYAKEFLWKLEPAFIDDKLFFKLQHHASGRYMKLAKNQDRDGDYLAYASLESDTDRHLWFFQPVQHDGIMLFFIVNKHHYQALKLALRAYEGNRKTFGIGGDFASHPDKYGWRVQIRVDARNFWKSPDKDEN